MCVLSIGTIPVDKAMTYFSAVVTIIILQLGIPIKDNAIFGVCTVILRVLHSKDNAIVKPFLSMNISTE